MSSLTLKNVPDKLMDLLREAAEVERRSLSQEALYLIEEGLQRRLGDGTPLKPHVALQVAAWERIAGRWRSEKPIAGEVKVVLDARTHGRRVDL